MFTRLHHALLTAALLLLAPAAMAHPDHLLPSANAAAAAAEDADSQREEVDDLFSIFIQSVTQTPARHHQAVLESAKRLFDCQQDRLPPEQQDAVLEEARALFEQLQRVYPHLHIVWDGQRATLEQTDALTLTAGLPRPVLLEVSNRSDAVVQVQASQQGQPPAWQPAEIAPGANMLMLVELTAPTDAQQVALALHGLAEAPQVLQVPVRVQQPAVLKGTLLGEAEDAPLPAKLHVLGSDGLYRYGKKYGDNPTFTRKTITHFLGTAVYFEAVPFSYSDGRFEVLVPPGEVQATIERGFERPLVMQRVELAPGETKSITLRSERHINMKAEGWVSGDTHIHWVENSWDVNLPLEMLAMVQRAEDLRVANNLLLYQYRTEQHGGTFIKPDQRPMGPIAEFSGSDYHMQMAEEYRNDNHYGHICLLNIKELIEPIATGPGSGGPTDAIDYPLNKTAIEEAHSQGGISVEAHGLGPFHASGVAVNAIHDLSDSLDQIGPEHYYHFLNCGLHLPLTNGSDHPARIVGCARAYVAVDGDFTYEKWIEGIRQCRTFTTSGPLIFLTVNGAGIGETLDVQPGEKLRVQARVWSRRPIGNFQIVSNGVVIRQKQTQDQEVDFDFEVEADTPRWFAARCSPHDIYSAIYGPDIAHTSAVYVDMNGRGVIKAEAARFFVENVKRHLERLKATANFENASQEQEAVAYIESALRRYEALIAEAEEEKVGKNN